MSKMAAGRESVGFRDGEAGAGDRFFNAEALSKAAHKSSFAGANITN